MKISDILQTTRPTVSFEFFPPKADEAMANLLQTLSHLHELRPSFATCTCGAGGSIYLVATPVQTAGAPWSNYYNGCRVYRFANIDSALLEASGSQPALIGSVSGTAGSFNGACAYDASANMSGMLYSEAKTSVTDVFRIYMSHKNF